MFEKILSLEITPRMQQVRTEIMRHPVATATDTYSDLFYPLYSGDRWLTKAWLEGWINGAGEATTQLRAAHAEAYALDHSEPVIGSYDLIAGQPYFPTLSQEEMQQMHRMAAEFRTYVTNRTRGRDDHVSMDFYKLLKVGVRGLLREIREYRDALDLESPETLAESVEKLEFYTACEMELEALLRLQQRYAAKARELAYAAEKPEQAANYLELAAVLDKVPAEPAATFREAIQSVHFYTFSAMGLYVAGHPDRYLLEYYRRDIANGTLTVEFAQELVDNYCMLFSTYVFSRAACSIMLSGSNAAGEHVDNALTAHFLRSISHVNRPDPNYSYALSSNPDPELFAFALKMIAEGYTHPSFYNDDGIIRSLKQHGIPEDEACEYTNTSCSEITICGKTRAWTTSPFVNLMEVFYTALHNGKRYSDTEALFQGFKEELFKTVERECAIRHFWYLEKKRNGGSDPARISCLVDDCLSRGKSICAGGARYNPLMPSFVGLGNVTESLITCDQLVFRSHEYTLQDLTAIVDNDYKDHEEVRQRIIRKLPHYGNADPTADHYATKVADSLLECCEKFSNFWGNKQVPGAFAYMAHSYMGNRPGADGRHAGTPLGNCPGPVNAFDVNGVTSSLLSSSTWDQTAFLGGITMNIKLTRKIMNDAGFERLKALILTFFARNGKQLQINCVQPETLKEAQQHPEEYQNLMVRVGGYSEYFVRLDEKLQSEIINRAEFSI